MWGRKSSQLLDILVSSGYNICMITTINISLPKTMYVDAKKAVEKNKYTSISELFRDALRRLLYEDLTGNLRKFVEKPAADHGDKKVYGEK